MGRTVEFIYGCERRTVIVIHVDVRIIVLVFRN
jgi:hypothetical protein